MFALFVHYMNGSSWSYTFPTYGDAMHYARENISYSGDRVARVELIFPDKTHRKLWSHNWSDISKIEGLKIVR